jgi:hypothetical protein
MSRKSHKAKQAHRAKELSNGFKIDSLADILLNHIDNTNNNFAIINESNKCKSDYHSNINHGVPIEEATIMFGECIENALNH